MFSVAKCHKLPPIKSCSDLREALSGSRRKWRRIVEYMASKERNSGPFSSRKWVVSVLGTISLNSRQYGVVYGYIIDLTIPSSNTN